MDDSLVVEVEGEVGGSLKEKSKEKKVRLASRWRGSIERWILASEGRRRRKEEEVSSPEAIRPRRRSSSFHTGKWRILR